MKIISKAEKIRGVIKAWHETYWDTLKREWRYGPDKGGIYRKLSSAKSLTEKKISDIIGNDSWTQNICDECGKDSAALIQLGQGPDEGMAIASICLACIRKALKQF